MLKKLVALLIAGIGAWAVSHAIAFAEEAGDGIMEATSEATPRNQRPVVLTTDEQIERAKVRVENRIQPFYRSWIETLEAADRALTKTYVPDHNENHEVYFKLALEHARDVRHLAIAYLITGDEQYFHKARTILTDWAKDALQSPHPGSGSPHSSGLVVGRIVTIFADGYALLWPELDAAERELIEAWFRKSVDAIRMSRHIWETADEICVYGECRRPGAPWLGRQNFNNHLGTQNMGIVAIGFTLKDEALIREGMDSPDNPRNLKTLLEGTILIDNDDAIYRDLTFRKGYPDVQPGEIFDRYRTGNGRGLLYTHIHLRFLALQAEMAANNGYPVDWFAYTGPKGQNLELSFNFYSEFLISGDPTARGGYYKDSFIDWGLLPLYEIAHNHYPENEQIRKVLESAGTGRLTFDDETFGWSLPLTHGADDISFTKKVSWEFEEDGIAEGWRPGQYASMHVAGGALSVSATAADRRVFSPQWLDIDAEAYENIVVRLRNTSRSALLGVAFITDSDDVFDVAKTKIVRVDPMDASVKEYAIPMGDNARWRGRIEQIRLEIVDRSIEGAVEIDSVRFE